MSGSDPVKVLILETSQNRAEELIVLLRNTGHATRAHQIESEEDFLAALKDQIWDLCLASPKVNDLGYERAVEIIRDQEKDIPFILLAQSMDPAVITEGLRKGADDVALEDDDDRLALIINRELGNLSHRRIRRAVEVSLRETERRCQLLLDSSLSAIAYVHEGMHIYANKSYMDCFGFEEMEDLEGVPIIDLIAAEDQDQFKALLRTQDPSDLEAVELSCVHSDGSKMMLEMSMCPAQYDGEPCTQVIFKSMLGEDELADRIKELGSQDILTGLFNRQYFMEQLDRAVDQAVSGEQGSTVLYIKLDRFVQLRTDAGFANADIILSDVASLIREKAEVSSVLARFGDDVFTLLQPGTDRISVQRVAEKIRREVADHVSEISGKAYHLTVSIGIASTTENSPTGEELISRAHRASEASENGNTVTFYQKDAPTKALEKPREKEEHRIAVLLKDSIRNNSLKLLFQPIISLHSDQDEQFEVLLRLLGEDGNEIQPARFLDAAINSGLAPKMDRWVTLQSIRTLAAHRASGSGARLFVNITYKTIQDETFLPWVATALKAARLPSDSVIFQMHESDVTTYLRPAGKFTGRVAEIHGKTSINHFGCSLNPFKTLQSLSVDYVKLDGSFARQIERSNEKKRELLDMVKSLQSIGVLTAISGVENPIVLSTLWEAGLNFIQGNYLSPPLENLQYDFNSEDL